MKLDTLNSELADKTTEDIIDWDYKRNGGRQVMTTSFGIEAALMVHLISSFKRKIPVIFIDTGFLFPETLEFGLELTNRFDLNLKVYRPTLSAEEIQTQFGDLWNTDPVRYGWITKKEPLIRALKELSAASVLHGNRAYQNDNRAKFQIVMQDDDDSPLRIYPILKWSEDEVLSYFKKHNLPYHPLLKNGYGSVGDYHSTIPGPGRSGRWPGQEKTECDLHRTLIDGAGI